MTKIFSNFSIESEISLVWSPEYNLTICCRTEIVKLIRDHLVEIDRSLIQGIDRNQFIGGNKLLEWKVFYGPNEKRLQKEDFDKMCNGFFCLEIQAIYYNEIVRQFSRKKAC